jgi:RNA polymerase sigma-70 factor (ECF subfamily)
LKNEIEIIQAIGKGNDQAFSMLYERYSERVYNTALSYTKNAEDAEEIAQDVFVKIYKSAATFKGNSTLKTWIYRIVVNTSLNYLKKNNRLTLFKSTLNDSQSINFDHPGVLLENKENASILYKAMDCLPSAQQTAFILSFIEYLPRQEVANIMETSLKAVESLLQRAKNNMRSELEKVYPHRRKSKK